MGSVKTLEPVSSSHGTRMAPRASSFQLGMVGTNHPEVEVLLLGNAGLGQRGGTHSVPR